MTKVKYPLATWTECKLGEVLLRRRSLSYTCTQSLPFSTIQVVAMSKDRWALWSLCLIGHIHVLDHEQVGRAYAITLRKEKDNLHFDFS